MTAKLPVSIVTKKPYPARCGFLFGNASYCYQHQFSEVAGLEAALSAGEPGEDGLDWLERQLLLNPDSGSQTARELLQVYFAEWLEGLPETIRPIMEKLGLDDAKRGWPFRRYVLERNDRGMNEFLKRNLSAEDYAYNQQLGKSLKNG